MSERETNRERHSAPRQGAEQKPPTKRGAASAKEEQAGLDDLRAQLRWAASQVGDASGTRRATTPPPPPPPTETHPPAAQAPRPAAQAPPPPPPPPPPQQQPQPSYQPPSYQPPPPPPPPSYQPPSYGGGSAPPSSGGGGRGKLIVGVVIGALLLAGVGVGGVLLLADRGPTKAEFIEEADALCEASQASVSSEPTSYPELGTASEGLAADIRSQLVDLRALDTPGGETRLAIEAVWNGLDDTAGAADRLSNVADSRDDAAAVSATHEVGGTFNNTTGKARELGLAQCALQLQGAVNTVFAGTNAVVKASYVAKAEAECRTTVREADELPVPTFGNINSIVRYLNQIESLIEQMLDNIEGLTIPPGDEDTVASMISSFRAMIATEREWIAAFAAEDFSRADAIELEVETLLTATDAQLDAYGLSVCGSNFGNL